MRMFAIVIRAQGATLRLCAAMLVIAAWIAGCASTSRTFKNEDEQTKSEVILQAEFRDTTYALQHIRALTICPLQKREPVKMRGTNWVPPVVLPADSICTAHAGHLADQVTSRQTDITISLSPVVDSFITDAELIATARTAHQSDAVLIERLTALSNLNATSGGPMPSLTGGNAARSEASLQYRLYDAATGELRWSVAVVSKIEAKGRSSLFGLSGKNDPPPGVERALLEAAQRALTQLPL